MKLLIRIANGFFPAMKTLWEMMKGFRFLRAPFSFIRDCFSYIYANKSNKDFSFSLKNIFPILYDRYEKAGDFPLHYFFQDIWAAKNVYGLGVKKHYDIGSRLDGFIAHCLAFCTVVMLDIRPLSKKVDNLQFIEADCTKLDGIETESLDSISALHVVEHFGLGRYGDPIDPDSYISVINEMQRVVKKGGSIIFSTPIGRERLEFNAHRVFNPYRIKDLFSQCELVEFSAVTDSNDFVSNAEMNDFVQAIYSCGLYHFIKK